MSIFFSCGCESSGWGNGHHKIVISVCLTIDSGHFAVRNRRVDDVEMGT